MSVIEVKEIEENNNEGPNDWTAEEHLKLLLDRNQDHYLSDGAALQMPKWFDPDKFRRGQKYFKENYFALFVSKLCGLVAILTVPEISRILLMTNLSSEPNTAFKRYLSTIAHMLLWYGGDITDKSSWAFKSLKDVSNKHTAASNRGSKEGKGHISQSALALTQFGFMGYGLLKPHKLGIRADNEEDIEGFVHFWRTIGFLVGVQDRYNICRTSVSETKAICNAILEQMFVPGMLKPDKPFTDLSTSLLQGMWAIVPQIDVSGFSTFVQYVSGIEVAKCSSWYSQFMFNFQKFVHETLLGSKWFGEMFRKFLNFHMWFTIVINCKFPILAYFTFKVPLKPLVLYKS